MKNKSANIASIVLIAVSLTRPCSMLSQNMSPFVHPVRGHLRLGGENVRFWCADNIRLFVPQFLGEEDESVRAEKFTAAADKNRELVLKLHRAGFNLVKLDNIPAKGAGTLRIDELYDSFVWECKRQGILIWANALIPNIIYPPVPENVFCLDDPSTVSAWTNAVTEANGINFLMTARIWDPRYEIVLQQRVREWARGFNTYSGLRRCDDPVFVLWSFDYESWKSDIISFFDIMPEFFRQGLVSSWNNYLYRRYDSTESLKQIWGILDDSESLESGTVKFCAPYAIGIERNNTQNEFLQYICQEHMQRIVQPFIMFGTSTLLSPRHVDISEPYNANEEEPLSTISILKNIENESQTPAVYFFQNASDIGEGIYTALAALSNNISVVCITHPDLSLVQNRIASQLFLKNNDGIIYADNMQYADTPDLLFIRTAISSQPKNLSFPNSGINVSDLQTKNEDEDAEIILTVASRTKEPISQSSSIVLTCFQFARQNQTEGNIAEIAFNVESHALKDKSLITYNQNGDFVNEGDVKGNSFTAEMKMQTLDVEFFDNNNLIKKIRK